MPSNTHRHHKLLKFKYKTPRVQVSPYCDNNCALQDAGTAASLSRDTHEFISSFNKSLIQSKSSSTNLL